MKNRVSLPGTSRSVEDPLTAARAAAQSRGLYRPDHEHDACGIGFVANIHGQKSHQIVEQGLQILKNLTHRGAMGSEPLQTDGAGILLQIPDDFFRTAMAKQDITLPPAGEYGVGMVFLPQEHASRIACQQEIERAVRAEGQVVLGWRDVPVNREMPMAESVRTSEPVIRQILIGRGPDVFVTDALERKLYIIRKRSGHAIQALRLKHGKEFYVASFSTRTILYKGLLLADQISEYYPDLRDPQFVSALAMVHQRFSTNTFPAWELAQPFRLISHNGEINTLRGNVNWIRAREKAVSSSVLGEDITKIWPLIYDGQSDSASLDNALELLVMSGYSLAHAMMILIPEAWEKHISMDENRRAFYEYYAAMMEPWDGPAAVAFTDGRQIGATLDRNGLRPARYYVTADDQVILASEAGVLPVPEERIISKWRLQPGKMLLIDLERGRIISDDELKSALSNAKPYREWVGKIEIKLAGVNIPDMTRPEFPGPLLDWQRAFGYTQEDIKFILQPMAEHGEEAKGSMGNDAPLAVLSARPKPFYHYFRQLFAHVTNPPIDPIREEWCMSLTSFIGPKPNLLEIIAINPPIRLEVSQPVLGFTDMAKIRRIETPTANKFRPYELDICYPVAWGKEGIEARLASLAAEAEDAVHSGANILIVSDRRMNAHSVAIPALLATSAVHQCLVRKGLRTSTGLIVETGSAREVHHFALLAGYGAEAIHPYLALMTLESMAGGDPETAEKYIANYIKAIDEGLLKVMSKMGISTYMSYTGAQIFETIGLQRNFVDQYFTGTASHIEGIGIFEIAEEAIRIHQAAFGTGPLLQARLDAGGEYAFRTQGEDHGWTPEIIARLQHAARSGKYETYQSFANLVNDQSKCSTTLRGLFDLKLASCPVPLDEVEDAKEIVKRFTTGAMSIGSISTEAHATLAIAMNRIASRSNTGEGGEDTRRYRTIAHDTTLAGVLGVKRVASSVQIKAGDSLRSSIKQVASARFGVTTDYLINADQLQIKMEQGAKPGEGGQLPAGKVSEYIGHLRHCVVGVGLISPPPHHDIYSIEDLAQLIYDLKNVNEQASISVKLVAEAGIGTVAAGVAKAKAEHLVVSGHDGGTGASPISSIKHVGCPWEIGLAEVQQTLVLNRLRGRIRIQVDGRLRTGRDVVIGALLGADEFGFATAPLVVEGCVMTRKCHLNTCPVGVATQDPELRKRFTGQPEHVVNYFFFVAQEVRELMAALGIRRFDDLVGRVDLLDTRKGILHWKEQGLDFSRIFYQPSMPDDVARCHKEKQDHGLTEVLDRQLIEQAAPALERQQPVYIEIPVRNTQRSIGAMLSGEVIRRHGRTGMPACTIEVRMTGTAGQSFGAFLANGIAFDLIGDANDYVGKGLSGGRIIVRPHPDFAGETQKNIIVGNAVLYGATSGDAYIAGVAGERFCVRNSGVTAVIEGVGDHGCEYMTNGTVVVLGKTGRNFAAGMSGGIVYVYDDDGSFPGRCNMAQVTLEPVRAAAPPQPGELRHLGIADEVLLHTMIERHVELTGSAYARRILSDWDVNLKRFVKVFPHDYRRALNRLAEQERRR